MLKQTLMNLGVIEQSKMIITEVKQKKVEILKKCTKNNRSTS